MDTEQTQDITVEVKEAPAEQPVPDKQRFRICPCCHKPTLPMVPEINKDVMDHFMVCLMTGVPFSNTYKMYNGAVSVCIEQMNSEEAALVVDAATILTPLITDDRLIASGISAENMRSAIRLMCNVKTISFSLGTDSRIYHPKDVVLSACRQIKDFSGFLGDDWTEDRIARLHDIFDRLSSPENMSGLAVRQLLSLVETHIKVYDILMDKGFDENFWTGIKLV